MRQAYQLMLYQVYNFFKTIFIQYMNEVCNLFTNIKFCNYI
jgi:hypothetical protein